MGSQSPRRVAIRDETAIRLHGIAMTSGGLLVGVAVRFLRLWPPLILFGVINVTAVGIDVFEPVWLPGHREAAAIFWLLFLICAAGIFASRNLLDLGLLLVKPRSPLFPLVLTSGVAVALVSAIPGSNLTWHLHLVLWFVSCYAPALSGIDSDQWEWRKTAGHLTVGSCVLNTFLVVPAFPLVIEVWILFAVAVLGPVRGVVPSYGLILLAGSAVTLLLRRADVDLPAAAMCMVLLVLFTIVFAPSLIWIRSLLAQDRWRKRTYLNRTRTGIGPQHFV